MEQEFAALVVMVKSMADAILAQAQKIEDLQARVKTLETPNGDSELYLNPSYEG